MLEELEAKYQLVPINITRASNIEQFRRISPNHKIPALTHWEKESDAPVHLFESGAILLYLGDGLNWYQLTPRTIEIVLCGSCGRWPVWVHGRQATIFSGMLQRTCLTRRRYLNECQRLYGVLKIGSESLSCGWRIQYYRYSDGGFTDTSVTRLIWLNSQVLAPVSEFAGKT